LGCGWELYFGDRPGRQDPDPGSQHSSVGLDLGANPAKPLLISTQMDPACKIPDPACAQAEDRTDHDCSGVNASAAGVPSPPPRVHSTLVEWDFSKLGSWFGPSVFAFEGTHSRLVRKKYVEYKQSTFSTHSM
jgi:hypothetical protein